VKDILHWLNTNSGAVTALAAVAGVVITAIYTLFTIGLWRQTKRQAEITRNIFEASNRPYIILICEEPTDTESSGHFSFNISFQNKGTVPAHLTQWQIDAKIMDLDANWDSVAPIDPLSTPVGRSLGPSEEEQLPISFNYPWLRDSTLPFRLVGRVDYEGVASLSYSTTFDAERVRGRWERQGYKII